MRALLLGCVLGAGVAALGAALAPVHADPSYHGGRFPWQVRQNYPWCAFYNTAGGMTECLYTNIAQCRMSVSGVGGYCYENPAYVGPPPPPRRARKPQY